MYMTKHVMYETVPLITGRTCIYFSGGGYPPPKKKNHPKTMYLYDTNAKSSTLAAFLHGVN